MIKEKYSMKYSTHNVSSEVRIKINEITQAVNSGETVIFCGAGISRNSGLPVVNQLVPSILNKLNLPQKDKERILDSNNNPKIPFELFIQNLKLSCEVNEILSIYELGVPNTNQLLIAKLIKTGKVKTVVTTNFDKLIEKALGMKPKILKEGIDYDVISNEQSFEKINWSDSRIRIIKIHGSVDDKESMAMTLKQVANQVLSKPREAIIREIFSKGENINVLILGYSSSDVFDISPQIKAIKENHKRVYYLQHPNNINDTPKVENIQEQNDKNPFKEFKDSWRIFYDTDQFIKDLWEATINNIEPYELKTSQTNWIEYVTQWHRSAIMEYRESIRFSIPAHIYILMGELDAAIEYYLQALKCTKDIDDKTQEQVCLGNLGNAYMSKGRYCKAIEYAEQALELARKIGDKKREGSWLGSLGNAYLKKGDYIEAIDYYEQALKVIRANGHNQKAGTWLGNLGIIYKNIGDYANAIKYSEEALKIDREIGDKRGEGARLVNIGNVYLNTGEYIIAKEYFEQALKIDKEIRNKQGEAISLGNLGNVNFRIGEKGKAKEYFEQALSIAKEIGDKEREGACFGYLAVFYKNSGDYGMAIEYSEKALKIAEGIGDKKGKSTAFNNLGNAYKNLGEFSKAKQSYEAALEIAKEIGDKKGEGLCLGNLGIICMRKGRFPEAIEYYSQARIIAKEIGLKKEEGIWLANLGIACMYKKEYAKAKEYYKAALENAKEIVDKKGEAQCLGNIGSIFFIEGEYEEAEKYAEEAFCIVKQLLGSENPETINYENNLHRIRSKKSKLL